MSGQKPGFFENIWLQAKRWEKTRFLKIVRGRPEIGFLREYLVTGEEMGKNPVSKDCARAARNIG